MMGNMARMVFEISLTESSMPPIWAKMELETNKKRMVMNCDFRIS